jgi:outer membrane immunogenic protein
MKMTSLLGVGVTLFTTSAGLAQSSNEILRRLEALERDNAALRARVHQLEGGRRSTHAHSARAGEAAPVRKQAETPYETAKEAAFNWTGWRVGGFTSITAWEPQIGGQLVGGPLKGTAGFGIAGGARLGYDWQLGSLVAGVQGSIMGILGDKSATPIYPQGILGKSGEWVKTYAIAELTGRAGLALDRTLIYGVAGVGGILSKSTFAYPYLAHDLTAASWAPALVLGGGVEYAITPHWVVGAEGEYLFAARQEYKQDPIFYYPISSPFTRSTTFGVTPSQALLKFGTNYRF